VGGQSGDIWLLPCVASDRDGDGGDDGADCAPDDGDAWAPPGEARDLRLERDVGAVVLTWSWPHEPGASTLVHDVLRAPAPDGFTAAACVVSDAPATSARDDGAPASALSCYLVRSENVCPDGVGPLGRRSDGGGREGRSCP
jgi:hypothetical protein